MCLKMKDVSVGLYIFFFFFFPFGQEKKTIINYSESLVIKRLLVYV